MRVQNVTGALESSQKLWSLGHPITQSTDLENPSMGLSSCSSSLTKVPKDSPRMTRYRNRGCRAPLKTPTVLVSDVDLVRPEKTSSDGEDKSDVQLSSRRLIQNDEVGWKSSASEWVSKTIMRSTGKKDKISEDERAEHHHHHLDQRFVVRGDGAVDSFGDVALPIEKQFDMFQSTYSRVGPFFDCGC